MVIKMQFGKRILLLLCAVLMLFSMFPTIRSGASSGPSLVTTLTDNAVQRGSKLHVELYRGGGEHRHGVRLLRRRQKEAVDLPHPIPACRAGRGDRQGDLECGGVHGRMRLHRRTDGGPDPRRGNGGGTASAPAVGERLGRLLWGDGKVLVLPCLYRGRHGIGGTLQ